MAVKKRAPRTLPQSDRGVPVSTRPAMPWATTPGMYIAGKEALDAADDLGVQMDRKWGVGRMRLLVDGKLREKFDRQRYLTAQARWEGTLEDVKRESARMVTAYRALDDAAMALGASLVDDSVWEVGIPIGMLKGSVLAIVKNDEALPKVAAEGRNVIAVTLDEVARIIGYDHDTLMVKQTFPGAQIEPAKAPIDPMRPSLVMMEEGIPDIKAPIDSVAGFEDSVNASKKLRSFDWEQGDAVPF